MVKTRAGNDELTEGSCSTEWLYSKIVNFNTGKCTVRYVVENNPKIHRKWWAATYNYSSKTLNFWQIVPWKHLVNASSQKQNKIIKKGWQCNGKHYYRIIGEFSSDGTDGHLTSCSKQGHLWDEPSCSVLCPGSSWKPLRFIRACTASLGSLLHCLPVLMGKVLLKSRPNLSYLYLNPFSIRDP